MDVIALACIALLLAILLPQFPKWWRRRTLLARIPGPPSWPLLGNTLEIKAHNYNMTKAIQQWTDQYKDIFKIEIGADARVFLSKPADIEILLTSTKHITKSSGYDDFHDWIGTGLLTSTGQKWRGRRKLITPSFHFSILEQFIEVFNRNSDILAARMLEEKKVINVLHYANLCSLDIICETAMGTSVNAQKQEESKYVQAVNDACVSVHLRGSMPWLKLRCIFEKSAVGKVFYSAIAVMHSHTRSVIAARKKDRMVSTGDSSKRKDDDDIGRKKHTAFLDQLLDASNSSGEKLSDADIQEEVDTFMFEGHDTTSAAITFALYCVAAHPEVQQRLHEEMGEIFDGSDRDATMQDLLSMNYMERVIKEMLRLYPTVPMFARRTSGELELTNGIVIPANTDLMVSVKMTHLNPVHWPEPEKFDPDRFLPENSAGRHPFAYVPFSAGPRNCIGQKFAMLEVKSAVSKVVRRCTLSLPEPGYKPEVQGLVILKAPEGVHIHVTRRQ